MNYELPEKLNCWHYLLLIAFLFFILSLYFDPIKILNYAIYSGLLIYSITWLIDYNNEQNVNKTLMGRLGYELRCNWAYIIDNIVLLNKSDFDKCGLLENYIFDSLVKSHKIIIIPKGTLDELFGFYNEVININNGLNSHNYEIAFEKLLSARKLLEKIFNELGLGKWCEANKLIGNRYSLKEETSSIVDRKGM